mgnify:CR=1 FL=1
MIRRTLRLGLAFALAASTLLAVALTKASNGWNATAITVGNISVNFLIPVLLALPSVLISSSMRPRCPR